MIQGHQSLKDEQFVDQFESLSFNPKWFNHEAHVRLAWSYLKLFTLPEAEERMCNSIQRFDATFDEGIKYHRTITIISLRIIKSRLVHRNFNDFNSFIKENIDLVRNLKDVIGTYYSWNIFSDAEAKVSFVAPDLKQIKIS